MDGSAGAYASGPAVAPGLLPDGGARTPPQRSLFKFALIGLGPLAMLGVFAIVVELVQRLG